MKSSTEIAAAEHKAGTAMKQKWGSINTHAFREAVDDIRIHVVEEGWYGRQVTERAQDQGLYGHGWQEQDQEREAVYGQEMSQEGHDGREAVYGKGMDPPEHDEPEKGGPEIGD